MGVYWNLVFDGGKLLFGGLAWPLRPSNLVCTLALPRTTPLPPYSCHWAGTEMENFSDTFNISVCFFILLDVLIVSSILANCLFQVNLRIFSASYSSSQILLA